ncbi:uncharacterized protein [Solanum lycopersicum]|uniref:uncharacterized protein n=1 Tax=Solanum lycopersicum TaxID=4081 RepID=UPI0037485CCE
MTCVHYNPGKANVVADALSRLSMGSVSHIDDEKKELVKEVHQLPRLGVRLVDTPSWGVSVYFSFESSFFVDVKAKKHLDLVLVELEDSLLSKMNESFSLVGMVLQILGQILCCVPNIDNLRPNIIAEAHGSMYSINPGSTKMYHDLKEIYW